MRSDALLSFVPIGGNQSLVAGAGIAIPSLNTIDLIGQGVGQPPGNIIGTVSVFGTDFGIGDDRVLLDVVIGTALASGNAATLNIAMQLAPDQGAAGNWQPGTWQTVVETGPLTVAQGVANTRVARFDWPPAFPENLRPRYARLLFQVAAGTNFTAGSIAYALVTSARDDWASQYAARNYTVL